MRVRKGCVCLLPMLRTWAYLAPWTLGGIRHTNVALDGLFAYSQAASG